MWRWHVLVKAPLHTPLGDLTAGALGALTSPPDVSVAIDVDPVDLL
jgi:primosomal protein N'